ncbi:MAG: DEAD/DEAH box helicase, partial [Deltaproteobacteria bacterium]|nr:DEAD/DEAH box helicase [Deltaproteobacteria bacterium]
MTDETNTETPEEAAPASQENAPDETLAWDDIALSPALRAGVDGRGYANPTAVQAKAIPIALEGHDLLVRSKTGSGKTAAFMIPTLDRIPAGYGKAGCVVMCPTRELAIQVAEEAAELCKEKELRIVRVYGGVPIGPQADALNAGAEVVIGTPGRIRDQIRRGNLDLSNALVGCLDEADEMLSMGFFEEVTSILDELPKDVQILLFSATVEAELKKLIGRYLKDPKEIYISVDNEQANKNIHHVLYETTLEYPKPRQLLYVMEKESPGSCIVFCNTRSDTETVARFLNRQGLGAEPISSDLTQKARERVMKRIKAGEIEVMVATDIAARGIDISDLTHVFNYSLPEDPAVYVHRTGRTGRIGKKGTAVSFMGGKEIQCRKVLEGKYEIDFEERELPTREEGERMWTNRGLREMKETMQAGMPFEGFLSMARHLREQGPGADAYVALALRGFFRFARMEKARKEMEAEFGEDAAFEMRERQSRGGPRGGGGRRDGGGRG